MTKKGEKEEKKKGEQKMAKGGGQLAWETPLSHAPVGLVSKLQVACAHTSTGISA